MQVSQQLISREEERERLLSALNSDKPELIALVGRRRVGKTFLVRKVYAEHIKIEITGLQHDSQKAQIRNFVLSMKAYGLYTETEEETNNWLDAFFLLTQALEQQNLQEKYVVFLDELPWMAGKRSDFISGFSYFWNSWASKQHIVVVICGSATSWMIEKVISDKGGLHNRITDILKLYPFNLKQVEEFLHSRNIKYPRYQVILLYMAFGGIPMYLNFVRRDLSAVQNINQLCFKEAGFLYDEFDRLFPALFDRWERHESIVKALAYKSRGLTRAEILQTTGLPNGGSFSRTLKELQQSGFIRLFSGMKKTKKDALYRLTDAYSLFYLHQIAPNKDNQTLDFEQLFSTPSFKTWSGYAFENICFSHLRQIKSILGISGVLTKTYSHISKPTEDLAGTQIDLLIDRNDHSIHICEIKFSKDLFVLDKNTTENIRQKKTLFKYHSKTKKYLFITFITTFGLVENKWSKEIVDQSLVMDDLFV
ncbi:MAG: ATP-binding protein [Bacteroidota bacterium]